MNQAIRSIVDGVRRKKIPLSAIHGLVNEEVRKLVGPGAHFGRLATAILVDYLAHGEYDRAAQFLREFITQNSTPFVMARPPISEGSSVAATE